ncbi:hypothetical protein QAD02_014667 [Eretmocerus hayati]|uniref:Uncharacterized protein n=1 Tax=Eretmocerus hayati TaxID=131215 RepID=A0ACC2P5M9_9HYME|nr:hypothetical protein QAD02_014667 [Eretmocerus hayati]
MRRAVLLLTIFSVACAEVPVWSNQETPLVTEFFWKYFDYDWKSAEQKKTYTKNGWYDPRAMYSIDVDRSPVDGRTFITIPRAPGVPASLHTVSAKYGESGPLLAPYPNWSWYESPDACKGITSVYRVAIDVCHRLWVLDTGRIGENRTCPAQLLAFDLYTDQLQVKVQIPDNLAVGKIGFGLLITPVVQIGSTCSNTTVYMAETVGGGLLVWDGSQMKRIEADIFRPEIKEGKFTIAGETFSLFDGIFGMALTPHEYQSGSRYLFFRPVASRSIYAVSTNDLKVDHNDTLRAIEGINYLPSQATVMAFSSQGTLFYGLTTEISIGCWNMRKQFTQKNFKIALTDTERLQFVSGIKVIRDPYSFVGLEEYLLITSNRLQLTMLGKQNLEEVNFRIMRVSVREIIENTECDSN